MPEFTSWYEAQWPKLVGALTVVVRDRALAEDIASEAMVRAYEHWGADEIRSPAAWVHRVGVNLARRRARRLALELRPSSAAARVADLTPTLEPAVWSAVASLPRQQRTAVALRYVGDLTQAQVAEAMGLSPGSVAATLSAARARLRGLLDPSLVEEL